MKIEDKKLLKQSFKDKHLNYLVIIWGIIIVANFVYGITTNNIKIYTITTNNIRFLISFLVATIVYFLIISIQIWFDYKSKLRNKP